MEDSHRERMDRAGRGEGRRTVVARAVRYNRRWPKGPQIRRGLTVMTRSKRPVGETPEARFVRLAGPRVTRVLKGLDLVGKLSGSRYKWSPEQLVAMEGAIHDAAVEAFGRFAPEKKKLISFSLTE